MKDISPEFNRTDALLLYSISYCQHHHYPATLGRILLTTDAINRSFPMAHELEDGLSRLMVCGYIEHQSELFTTTKVGARLYNDVTKPQNPKLNVFEEIKILANRLNSSRAKKVSKQLTITDTQVAEAIKEADALFEKINEEANDILNSRKAKGSSNF